MTAIPFLLRWLSLGRVERQQKLRSADLLLVERIRDAAQALRDQTADNLTTRVAELRSALAAGQGTCAHPDVILPAFTLVHEAVRRSLGVEYYDVQLLAGMALVRGQIAELATGEGKTLVQALAAFVFALGREGVHIMTSNSYLAQRDFEQLGPPLQMLGMTVGLLRQQANPQERRQAYAADITFGPGYEFGFDFLRDQIGKQTRSRQSLGEAVRGQLRGERPAETLVMQRGHAAAIVDEADSVLIDEANMPLILAETGNRLHAGAEVFRQAAAIAATLEPTCDFVLDRRHRAAHLTKEGLDRVMRQYLPPTALLEQAWPVYVEQALVARHLLCRDVDYIVDGDRVMLVDEATGRVFVDRSLRRGLHQAVEAKEQIAVTAEQRTLARVSRQQFFRLYKTLCGMTGTAQGAEQEFRAMYGRDVTLVPPRLPCQRQVLAPRFFADKASKRQAIVAEVRQCQAAGQPVLVGTRTIEESRRLAELLASEGISCTLLDGTQDADEARIVALAGQRGAVTVATNVAGRGTDIRLSPDSAAAGGLHVIATEFHASRRVDRQLLGRSARQGDPGSCRMYASAEDDLIRLHAPAVAHRMRKLADDRGEVHVDLSAAITRVQRHIEDHQRAQRRAMMQHDAWLQDTLKRLS